MVWGMVCVGRAAYEVAQQRQPHQQPEPDVRRQAQRAVGDLGEGGHPGLVDKGAGHGHGERGRR